MGFEGQHSMGGLALDSYIGGPKVVGNLEKDFLDETELEESQSINEERTLHNYRDGARITVEEVKTKYSDLGRGEDGFHRVRLTKEDGSNAELVSIGTYHRAEGGMSKTELHSFAQDLIAETQKRIEGPLEASYAIHIGQDGSNGHIHIHHLVKDADDAKTIITADKHWIERRAEIENRIKPISKAEERRNEARIESVTAPSSTERIDHAIMRNANHDNVINFVDAKNEVSGYTKEHFDGRVRSLEKAGVIENGKFNLETYSKVEAEKFEKLVEKNALYEGEVSKIAADLEKNVSIEIAKVEKAYGVDKAPEQVYAQESAEPWYSAYGSSQQHAKVSDLQQTATIVKDISIEFAPGVQEALASDIGNSHNIDNVNEMKKSHLNAASKNFEDGNFKRGERAQQYAKDLCSAITKGTIKSVEGRVLDRGAADLTYQKHQVAFAEKGLEKTQIEMSGLRKEYSDLKERSREINHQIIVRPNMDVRELHSKQEELESIHKKSSDLRVKIEAGHSIEKSFSNMRVNSLTTSMSVIKKAEAAHAGYLKNSLNMREKTLQGLQDKGLVRREGEKYTSKNDIKLAQHMNSADREKHVAKIEKSIGPKFSESLEKAAVKSLEKGVSFGQISRDFRDGFKQGKRGEQGSLADKATNIASGLTFGIANATVRSSVRLASAALSYGASKVVRAFENKIEQSRNKGFTDKQVAAIKREASKKENTLTISYTGQSKRGALDLAKKEGSHIKSENDKLSNSMANKLGVKSEKQRGELRSIVGRERNVSIHNTVSIEGKTVVLTVVKSNEKMLEADIKSKEIGEQTRGMKVNEQNVSHTGHENKFAAARAVDRESTSKRETANEYNDARLSKEVNTQEAKGRPGIGFVTNYDSDRVGSAKDFDKKLNDSPIANPKGADKGEEKEVEKKVESPKQAEPKAGEQKQDEIKKVDADVSKDEQKQAEPKVGEQKQDEPKINDQKQAEIKKVDADVSKDEQKQDADISKSEPKAGEQKQEEPKVGEQKQAEPKAGEPKKDADVSKDGQKQAEPKAGEQKQSEPKVGEQKKDADVSKGESKASESKAGEQKQAEPKAGEQKQEEPKVGEPKVGEQKQVEPKAGEKKQDEPKVGEQKKDADVSKAEPKASEPKAGEQKQEQTKQAEIKKVDADISKGEAKGDKVMDEKQDKTEDKRLADAQKRLQDQRAREVRSQSVDASKKNGMSK